MEADVKLCDGVILVMDARAVFACFNKRLDKVFGNKRSFIVSINAT